MRIIIPVKNALQKLGLDMSKARRRRRITMALLSERAGILPKTLGKIEKGDPTTSIAAYASVLFSLGLIERFREIADVSYDLVGRELEEELLPKRVRPPKKNFNNNE